MPSLETRLVLDLFILGACMARILYYEVGWLTVHFGIDDVEAHFVNCESFWNQPILCYGCQEVWTIASNQLIKNMYNIYYICIYIYMYIWYVVINQIPYPKIHIIDIRIITITPTYVLIHYVYIHIHRSYTYDMVWLHVTHTSMDWFKGKSTGNHRFSHEIWGFPVNFPIIQFYEYRYSKLSVRTEEEILCEEDRDLELQLLNAVKARASADVSLRPPAGMPADQEMGSEMRNLSSENRLVKMVDLINHMLIEWSLMGFNMIYSFNHQEIGIFHGEWRGFHRLAWGFDRFRNGGNNSPSV